MQWLWTNTLIYFLFSSSYLLYAQENVTEPILEITTNSTENTAKAQNDLIFINNTQENNTGIIPRMVTYCTTPNGDMAFCMPIMMCKKLMNQIENKSATKFLQESTCGSKNENRSNPFVCCGKYSNFKRQDNILPKTCGHQNITIRGRILGGKEAKLGEFPWLARLYHKDKAGILVFGCSGFLITSKFILTAAHCLESQNNDILGPVSEIHLGEHDTDTDIDCTVTNKTCADEIQKAGVKNMFVHPGYNMRSIHHHNDIGLILLKKAAKFTSYVSPICLMENLDFEPFEYWLSGWGRTETDSLSHVKLKLSIPPFHHSNCTKKYGAINVKILNKQLCAGGQKNKDGCTGDSGGPLMVADKTQWFAAGVVSYGLGCGREGWPGVYTNITSYTDWIRTTISKNLKSNNEKTRSAQIKN